MGFCSTDEHLTIKNKLYNELILQLTTEDFKKYGIIGEMLGRLPVICPMQELTTEQLVQILVEPKNSIVKQYKELFKLDNSELVFNEDALMCIADKAIKRKVGARGLRSIMEKILTHTMSIIPDKKFDTVVTITKECIENNTDPKIIKKQKVTKRKKVVAQNESK